MGEIVNKVANSKLVVFDLEDHYPEGKRIAFDIKDWLFMELVLKEKDFREKAKTHDWTQYKDAYVALHCSSEAIVPGWAYLLLTSYLAPHTKKVITGSLIDLENTLYAEILQNTDFSKYKDLPIIIKGCSNKPVPENAYTLLIQKLQPLAKSIFYGEACSSVPIFKKK